MSDGVQGETPGSEDAQLSGTIACVDVQPWPSGPGACVAAPGADVSRLALGWIEAAVRADDRICPLSTSRIAVEFGSVASGVLPQVLGDRLARAVGLQALSDRSTRLAVSVGMASPEPHLSRMDVARHALHAAQAGRAELGRRLTTGGRALEAVVTVDRLVKRRPSSTSGRVFEAIHHRSVYRYEADHVRGVPSLRLRFPTPHGDDTPAAKDGAGQTVLVVDPVTSRTGQPGLAAMSAAAVVERLGCRTAAVSVNPDDQLAMAIDGFAVELVVLVLDGARVSNSPKWASGTWGVPARLAASYQASDVPVLVVSAGASAGAIASCVAQGAVALFDFDGLPDALTALGKLEFDEARQMVELGAPPQYRALLGLTASERRVLYYLTQGWTAQDIADELVVSLTTVRSHIRSVLRKLGVRSQLAAVAIANGRDHEVSESTEAS